MSRAKLITPTRLLRAIAGSRGITKRVAEKLGVDWHTARDAIAADEAAARAFSAERELLLDAAEVTIATAIDGGDVQSAKWTLARLGRSRGWGDALELTNDDIDSAIARELDRLAGLASRDQVAPPRSTPGDPDPA